MKCDFCPADLDEGTAPLVDAKGRPVEFACPECHAIRVRERSERLATRLLEEYGELWKRQVRPRLGH